MDQDNVIPEITVLMPVYNAARYLKAAMESILNQTYTNFTFLIINDGSTDDSKNIILSFADPRIRYVENEQNIGLVATLNKGIDYTETVYLARMDADDLAIPERLQLQIEFLQSNLEIGVCGGLFEIFGDENRFVPLPLKNDTIKAELLFSNVICHPAVCLRTRILKENDLKFGVPFKYDDSFGHKVLELEDYALWQKLKSVTKFENLNKVLLRYRREGQNLSAQKLELIMNRKKKFYTYLLQELNIFPLETNLLLHISLKNAYDLKDSNSIGLFRKHLDEILNKNKEYGVYDPAALQEVVKNKWDQLFFYVAEMNLQFIMVYWKYSGSFKRDQLNFLIKKKVRLFLKKK